MSMNSFWRSKFAWSNSRHNQWAECKKQYYFNNIKKYDGLPNDPGRELLWRLSELQKMPFLKGRLIHEAVKHQISNHNAGRGVDADIAKNFFLSQFDSTVKDMNLVITEAANGFPPGEKEINDIRKDGIKQIENFCNIIWNNYKGVRCLGHEKNEEFFLDGIKVRIKYDLLTEKDGMHVITDWKTGSSGFDDVDENIQIGTYFTWLNKTNGISAGMIKGEVVYLKSCDTEIAEKTDADIKKIEEFIKKDSAEMLSVRSEKDFPASPEPKRCIGCNFLSVCKEGKEVISSLKSQ